MRIRAAGDAVVVGIARDLPTPMRGAALLAVLASPPTRDDDQDTHLACRRWCRFLAHAAEGEDPEWAYLPQLAAPADFAWPLDDALRGLPPMLRNIERRLGAAHAAARFLQAAEAAADGYANLRRARLSIQSEVIRTAIGEQELRDALAVVGASPFAALPADPDNFETRVLRPSLPVLHLAFAYAQAIGEVQRHLARRPELRDRHGIVASHSKAGFIYQGALGDLVQSTEFQERLLDRAGRLEALLGHMPKLRPSRAVHVEFEDCDVLVPGIVQFRPTIRSVTPAGTTAGATIQLPAEVSSEQVAITLLATLASPPSSANDASWHACIAAFYRIIWHRRLEAAPGMAETLQPTALAHLRMTVPRALQLVQAGERRIRQRLRAAGPLAPAVQALAGGRWPSPTKAAGGWSLAAEIRHFLHAEPCRARPAYLQPGIPVSGLAGPGTAAVKNFETRVIGPARPVLHLAVAFAFMLDEMKREQGPSAEPAGDLAPASQPGLDWWRIVDRHPEHAAIAVGIAERLEAHVLRLPAGGPDHGELVRLRVGG